jgi:predicted phage terminase large subunit-like protein
MHRYPSGRFIVTDVVRGRWSAGDLHAIIVQTARADGHHVLVREEQEPGSSGKAVVAARTRALAGFNYRGVPSTGPKEARWAPLAIQCEARNVSLRRGPWLDALLHELMLVPMAEHDDQADAMSGAFHALTLARPVDSGSLFGR